MNIYMLGGLISASMAIAIFGYNYTYDKGYAAGSSVEIVKAQHGLSQLTAIIAEGNARTVALDVKQKAAYNNALIVRNGEYKSIRTKLKLKGEALDELISKSGDTCINALIPAGFK